MLDAWIIDELKRREREQREERDRPTLQLPIPEYLPVPERNENSEPHPREPCPTRIEISYDEGEPKEPGIVNFEIYQM